MKTLILDFRFRYLGGALDGLLEFKERTFVCGVCNMFDPE